jgi:hypothetical protein
MAVLLLAGCYAPPAHDYMAIIDKSASMLVPDKNNPPPFKAVLDSVSKLADELKPGDRLFLFTFASGMKLVKSFARTKENQEGLKSDVIKTIKGIRFNGRWTYTQNMLAGTKQASEMLADKERQIVLLIFSDGRDDPPPNRKKMEISGLSSLPGKPGAEGQTSFLNTFVDTDSFVYYVKLSDLKNQKLEEGLTGLSSQSDSLGKPADPEQAMEDIAASVAKADEQKRIWNNPLVLAAAGLAALLLLAFLVWWLYNLRMRVRGWLRYYEKGFLSADKQLVELAKLRKRKLIIGRSLDADIRIKDLETKKEVILKNAGNIFKPELKVTSQADVIQQQDGPLESGSGFRVENIVFEYLGEEPE